MLIIASTDLQKEIVDGERVSSMLCSKTDSWEIYFERSAFYFLFLSFHIVLKEQPSVKLMCFCSAGKGRSHHQGVLRKKLPLD